MPENQETDEPKHIVCREKEGMFQIFLNRPPINAFNAEMVEEINRTLSDLLYRTDLKVVVFLTSGKNFCGGISPEDFTDDRSYQLIEALGIAHLHKAEMDNGLYHAPGDRCLLSVRGGTPLEKREDFDRAVDYFTKLLGTRADGFHVFVEVELNLLPGIVFENLMPVHMESEIWSLPPHVFPYLPPPGTCVPLAIEGTPSWSTRKSR